MGFHKISLLLIQTTRILVMDVNFMQFDIASSVTLGC